MRCVPHRTRRSAPAISDFQRCAATRLQPHDSRYSPLPPNLYISPGRVLLLEAHRAPQRSHKPGAWEFSDQCVPISPAWLRRKLCMRRLPRLQRNSSVLRTTWRPRHSQAKNVGRQCGTDARDGRLWLNRQTIESAHYYVFYGARAQLAAGTFQRRASVKFWVWRT